MLMQVTAISVSLSRRDLLQEELTMTLIIHKPTDTEIFVRELSEGVAELVWRDSTERSESGKSDTEIRRNSIEHRNIQS